jgi:hypothetical protein
MVFTEWTKKATLFPVLEEGREDRSGSGEAREDSMVVKVRLIEFGLRKNRMD